ncbi:hypothetical protein BKI52_16530 [marine bacterium AO1-C]|nr:hypothetical protein BKI52_16530 [marine bacterium AO1-C]
MVDYLDKKKQAALGLAKRVKYAQHSFDTYQCNLRKVSLKLYWKNRQNKYLKSLKNLWQHLKVQQQTLIFATNAGMFKANHHPVGLYIDNQQQISPLNLGQKRGNFFLKPNGVFMVTSNNEARIVESSQYPQNAQSVSYATQSGPLLLLNGEIHPKFGKNSPNRNIRSGAGIINKHEVVFAISNEEVTFYEFASFFKSLGCQNALYLDGHISQMYLPALKRYDDGGNFGVMIGVTVKQ